MYTPSAGVVPKKRVCFLWVTYFIMLVKKTVVNRIYGGVIYGEERNDMFCWYLYDPALL